MIALDTNLLIYAHRAGSPQSVRARRAIESAARQGQGWGVTHTTIAEFWTVATHPATAGGPSSPQQARDFLTSLVKAGARYFAPGDRFAERLTQMALELDIRGPRIFDLTIALTAFDNGATEIWTHDAGFLSIAGLRVRDPL